MIVFIVAWIKNGRETSAIEADRKRVILLFKRASKERVNFLNTVHTQDWKLLLRLTLYAPIALIKSCLEYSFLL